MYIPPVIFGDERPYRDAEVDRLRALIRKHPPTIRVLANVLEALSPLVLNREMARDALRDFEREIAR